MDYKDKYNKLISSLTNLYQTKMKPDEAYVIRKFLDDIMYEHKNERIIESLKSCVYAADLTSEGKKELIDWLDEQASSGGIRNERIKKIIPNNINNNLLNEEDYGIDGLWHAINILEKTIGTVEGYQSDDGVLEHQIAIDTIKKIYNH